MINCDNCKNQILHCKRHTVKCIEKIRELRTQNIHVYIEAAPESIGYERKDLLME